VAIRKSDLVSSPFGLLLRGPPDPSNKGEANRDDSFSLVQQKACSI
jgi:hypothetical protein